MTNAPAYDAELADAIERRLNGEAPRRTPPLTVLPGSDVITLGNVEPSRVEWLWPGRIALGKITILDGDPGLGKSTMLLDLAARLSRGGTTPTGDALGEPADTLLVTSEDDPSDTIRPRLDVAGGDPTRVHVLAKLSLPDDAARLIAALDLFKPRLIVVDPVVAHLADRVKSNVDHDVRRALEPLALLAAERHVAVVCIRHLNKGTGLSALYRGGGSIGFNGLARGVFAVGHDPDDEDRVVLACVKINTARRPASLAYRLVADGPYDPARVVWEGESLHTAETLIGRDQELGGDQSKTSALAEAIRNVVVLNGGEIAAAAAHRLLEDAGHKGSQGLMTMARKRAGVVSEKSSDGPWIWKIKGEPGQ